jgi:glyoxylase-like metal-dependent hydrolase (beta-lactamase superfamily II)
VYLVTHEPFFASNVLVVRMPDGAVVICSSPYETQASRALVGWVKATLRPSRMVAINTHFHFDGTGGNEAYRELGVLTYAASDTQRLLQEKGPAVQAEAPADFEDADRKRRIGAMKIHRSSKVGAPDISRLHHHHARRQREPDGIEAPRR